MTTLTTQASDDDFDRVEQGIDWIEKLEGIRAQARQRFGNRGDGGVREHAPGGGYRSGR